MARVHEDRPPQDEGLADTYSVGLAFQSCVSQNSEDESKQQHIRRDVEIKIEN